MPIPDRFCHADASRGITASGDGAATRHQP
jgi:hypothetical protein